nr:BON domain-containing protein [Azospirillum sp. SYSU D00513]
MAVTAAGCAPVVVGGAAATGAVIGSDRRGIEEVATDTGIQATINNLWFQHSIELHRRIDMSVSQGRVLLTGRATDPQMRLDAVRLAWQAQGVTEVINEIQVDNESGLVDSARDSWITTQLRTKLTFERGVRSANYSIETVNGVVYLMGIAAGQGELDKVTAIARSLPNVQRVVSYVRFLQP